ncbi:PSMD13 [Cordylochernes scorpioides]|uniref:26S proteasome non-ATPase regulatory subunit 13 n=1 Tax=Cordylochernes scorpioides TaxID=51811 RepID=A0ABY6KRV6_9ARAC|nr:PSMD13 [Cordylochernes scorpioides]
MPDVAGFLASKQTNSTSDVASEWAELEALYNKRLWHQLTLKIQNFVKSPHLQNETALVELYENFIGDFENKINPLALVEIITHVNKQISDYDQRVEFIKKTKEKVKGSAEAKVLCNILLGQLMLSHNDPTGVKNILEETENLMTELDGVTVVHGRYYQLCSDYHQLMGNHAAYYRDALRFLGCTDLDQIPAEEQRSRAFTLALAALLGEGVYNFGELLAHPIIEALRGTEKNWVVELLYIFNSGNLAKYEQLKPTWKSQPDLAAREIFLRQKISLLCLMEMTFRRPGNNRRLTFSEIAAEAQVLENEVELLVMKALSLGLVRGSLDQVDKVAHMTWVQPRVLEKSQISKMTQTLALWCQDVQSMELLLENKAQDILT